MTESRRSLSHVSIRILEDIRRYVAQTCVQSPLLDLETAHVSELHARFVKLFHEQPRSHNRSWLIHKIARRIHSLAEGGLSERARQRAAELAAGAEVRSMPPQRIEHRHIAPSTVATVKNPGITPLTVPHNRCGHGPHTDSDCVCRQPNSVEMPHEASR